MQCKQVTSERLVLGWICVVLLRQLKFPWFFFNGISAVGGFGFCYLQLFQEGQVVKGVGLQLTDVVHTEIPGK